MRNLLVLFGIFFLTSNAVAQEPYTFTEMENLEATPVISQGRTGTCWSFSALSFLESELIRKGKGEHDLSEMFIVRNAYIGKAENYLRYYGTFNFGPGGIS